jgi:chromosome segregation ATPase
VSAQTIATWLGIAAILATVIAKFTSLDEAKDTARTQIGDHERRLGAIERDQSNSERYHKLETQLSKVQWQLEEIQRQLEETPRRRVR